MRKTNWFIVAGLAVAAAVAPGCETTAGHDKAPGRDAGSRRFTMPYDGVVEIYRTDDLSQPLKPDQIVGYVSPVNGTTKSWWVLNPDEAPPVMADPNVVGGRYVVWKQKSAQPMTGQQICDNYGGNLKPTPQKWYVDNGGPPTPCGQ